MVIKSLLQSIVVVAAFIALGIIMATSPKPSPTTFESMPTPKEPGSESVTEIESASEIRPVPFPDMLPASSTRVFESANEPARESAQIFTPPSSLLKIPDIIIESPQTSPETLPSFLPTSQVNIAIRPAVVNILCTTKRGDFFRPITGSGVVIDSRGVILTNAHVAQYLLLNDRVSCVVRTGNPARPTYEAKLLYLPPSWIRANQNNINEAAPTGTGENDWALIQIGTVLNESAPLPPAIPRVAFRTMTDVLPEVNKVLLASYPAELVGGITSQIGLYQVSTVTTVLRGYYFDDAKPDAIDLISLGGNILAQGGSSGGAVIDLTDGALIGLIVTSTAADTTDGKDLRAITLSHINRSMRAHIGISLETFLQSNLDDHFDAFHATDFLTERQALLDSITRQ
ncbi:MAG: trypsin-like peptidase domain-containing protein [Candidatus Vogelbacteria bacterium]|nr:trypsin-like peptidase domain-containing protein [Candidatus Vogelbacteria bacterium]